MGSLRIHFTAEDLARIRVATGPDPLWEMVLSATVLGNRHTRPQYRAWQRETLTGLATSSDRGHVGAVAALVRPAGAFPDFLTPHLPDGAAADPTAAIEQVASTRPEQIRAELIEVFGRRPPPLWIRELATGSRSAMRELLTALAGYYRSALDRCGQQMADAVHADRQVRARQVLGGGAEALLDSLPAPISWSRPVLCAEYPSDRVVHLDGRGITLIPSYFCHERPVTLINPDLPPVLVYPATSGEPERVPSTPDALVKLMGRGRAQALAATRIACTTTELAGRIDSSVSMASRHAGVLAGAGLISSRRSGGSVVHAITDRGRGLLEQSGAGFAS